jgi:hypothetical protein
MEWHARFNLVLSIYSRIQTTTASKPSCQKRARNASKPFLCVCLSSFFPAQSGFKSTKRAFFAARATSEIFHSTWTSHTRYSIWLFQSLVSPWSLGLSCNFSMCSSCISKSNHSASFNRVMWSWLKGEKQTAFKSSRKSLTMGFATLSFQSRCYCECHVCWSLGTIEVRQKQAMYPYVDRILHSYTTCFSTRRFPSRPAKMQPLH